MKTHCIIQIAQIAYIVESGYVMPGDDVLYTGDLLACQWAYASNEFDLSHYGRVLGRSERVS